MALGTKLYRFKIELSNVATATYASLDFRIAQHPSETLLYMLTRVIAYALSYEEGIAFSASGLSDPDAPALQVTSPTGAVKLWIEIGNPSAKRLHKASKAAAQVKVFTYKDPQILLNEILNEQIHRRSELEIHSVSAAFLERLGEKLGKENRWTLIFMDGVMMINSLDFAEECEIKLHEIK